MRDLKTIKLMWNQLMFILNKKQKRNMLLMFLVILITSFFEMLGVSVILPFVQALTNVEGIMSNQYIQRTMQCFEITNPQIIIVILGLLVILVYVMKNVVLSISNYLQIRYKTSMTRQLKYQMMQSYMNRPYQFFVNSSSGEILRGVSNDVYGVQSVVEIVFRMITEIFVLMLIGGYAFYVDHIMILGIALTGAFCFMIIVLAIKRKLSGLGEVDRNANAEVNSTTVQVIQGIKDIFVKQRRSAFLKKFDNANEKSRKTQVVYQFLSSLPERVIETLCISGIMVVVLIRVNSGVNVAEFMASLAVFAVSAFRLLPSISRITGHVSTMIFLRPTLEGAYENIRSAREYMSLRAEEMIADNSLDSEISFNEAIELKNVYWMYNEENGAVLRNLSLSIRCGESVGIIGESGAGKSTLSDILLGLYRPQSGTVTVDGKSIFMIPQTWSRIMGYVPQSVYLMDDTIRNNVAFGEEDIDDGEVWNALEQASLRKFVESLPQGLDTQVGERGVKFSGGQRQRVAIARALYNKPSILILDEATSALDNETEAAVMEAIETLQGKMTMIIIAHRLTTIRQCDRIIKIENGEAVEMNKQEVLDK